MAQITRWKQRLSEQAAQVFSEASASGLPIFDVVPLYAAISQLQMENALQKNAAPMSVFQQRALVAQAEPGSSVQVRCQALGARAAVSTTSPVGKAPRVCA